MKKWFLSAIFVTLFLFGIIAVNAANESNYSNFNVSALSDNNIQETTNNALNKEIKLSPGFQKIARVVFGLKSDEKIDASDFVTLIGLWIILVVLIHEAVGFMPMFEKSALSWAVSIIITLIIAVSRAIKIMADFLFNIADTIKMITGWAILKLIFVLIILSALFFGLQMLLDMLKGKMRIEENREAGFWSLINNMFRS